MLATLIVRLAALSEVELTLTGGAIRLMGLFYSCLKLKYDSSETRFYMKYNKDSYDDFHYW